MGFLRAAAATISEAWWRIAGIQPRQPTRVAVIQEGIATLSATALAENHVQRRFTAPEHRSGPASSKRIAAGCASAALVRRRSAAGARPRRSGTSK
jgi:hypothetical protein